MEKNGINRRKFISKSAKGVAGLALTSILSNKVFPYISNSKIADKVIVLGIDGMDPVLLKRFVERGEMPTFKKLLSNGYFGQLQTTMPPQSPVAWSSFISGTNPGGHGIFDFIHRDPKTFVPYLSTSRSFNADKELTLGNWSIPLESGKVELLRRGPAFWTTLEDNDIPASLIKLPANFPVQPSESKAISGMGTPDLLGTYGTFTLFSDVDIPGSEHFTGGRVVKVQPKDHVIKSSLEGPPNTFHTDGQSTEIKFTVYRDPWEPVIKIQIQDHEIMLREGEWSDWLPLKFEFLPMFASVNGIVRIYVQKVHPEFRLYMSPINIDPMEAHVPISSPGGYSKELSDAIGRFYTQGFPEDTKALSNGIFSNEEFLSQTRIVLDERLRAFYHEFSQFNEGLFFFYFSSVDQNTHVMWRDMDPTHPLYEPNASREAKEAVYYFYRAIDNVLKECLSKATDRTAFMLLSDHGFAPFGREFHLSTWLVENGFTALTDPSKMHESEFYDYVDWSKTRAFALGLNGLYINLYGRETNGSVYLRDYQRIKDELIAKLEQVRDPKNGKLVLKRAYDTKKLYSGPYMELAPDIVLGYQSGYRISDEAVLGKFPNGIVGDRTDKWSADHCMDPEIVPGVLISNQEILNPKPGIWDLAPSILKKFGLSVPREMDGKPILA